MTDERAANAGASLREHLLSAADERLRRVAAVVDALPVRGDADALIAPLRPKLARLRPPRPLTLTRVLFMPVEPLIVPTDAWHPGSPGIPRAALTVLGNELAATLGAPAVAALRARFAGRTMADADAVAACGLVLWPQAAAALPAASHAAIVEPLGVLLAEGAALHRLPALAGPSAGTEAERLLRHAAPGGTAALAMMLALLLRRLPRAYRLLPLADSLGGSEAGGGGAASDRVVAFLLGDTAGAVAPGAALAEVADRMRRSARLLEELGTAAGAADRPARIRMLRAARSDLAAQCRDRLAAAAQALAAPAPGPAAPARLTEMEADARALRRLDVVGRRLGDAEACDRTLSAAAARLAAEPRLPPHARLRLAEILLGPDAALALCGES